MNLKFFKDLSVSKFCKHFMLKQYGLELLAILNENKNYDGIENLLQSLVSYKPKIPSFMSYLNLLENKKTIIIKQSLKKANMKSIELSQECRNEYFKIIENK